MADMTCPTVRIKNPHQVGGYIVINESDFDEEEHELFDEEEAEAETEALRERADDPSVTHEITPNGYWTVYRDGEVIEKGRGGPKLEAFLQSLQ